MTELSLRNPIAVAMACIGFVVFAAVVTPRMPIDTFPGLILYFARAFAVAGYFFSRMCPL